MLMHLLSDEKKEQLLKMARLLLVLEAPVLWDGKGKKDEVHLNGLKLDIPETQRNAFRDLDRKLDEIFIRDSEVDNYFLQKIKTFLLENSGGSADRLEIGKGAIHELIIPSATLHAEDSSIPKKKMTKLDPQAAWPYPTAKKS